MGFNLSGGFSAGAGADALEDLLKRVFIQQSERRRAKQEDQRINIDAERTRQGAEMQRAQLASMDEARKAAAQDREERTVQAMLESTAPDTNIDPALAGRVRAAGLGGMVPHTAADLPSTAISGGAQAGAAAPIMGSLRMAQAGRPARDTFTGTAGQLQVRQAAQDRAAQIAQAAQDRKDAAAQAAEDRRAAAVAAQEGRMDLARFAQGGREDMARIAAGLKAGDPAAAAAKQQNEVQDSLNLIDEIRTDPALASSVGPAEGRGMGLVTAGPEGYARVKALHDNLVNKLQLAQAGKLKGQGQISNMEREMLKNAATALDRTLGDADYLKQLAKVEQQFKRMLGTPAAAPPAGSAPKKSGFSVVEIKD